MQLCSSLGTYDWILPADKLSCDETVGLKNSLKEECRHEFAIESGLTLKKLISFKMLIWKMLI